jgi:hypothetical protein
MAPQMVSRCRIDRLAVEIRRDDRGLYDSPLEGTGFEPVWGFSCQVVIFWFVGGSLFGAGKAVLRPVACDQVRGARGRGQGTETVAKLGGFAA